MLHRSFPHSASSTEKTAVYILLLSLEYHSRCEEGQGSDHKLRHLSSDRTNMAPSIAGIVGAANPSYLPWVVGSSLLVLGIYWV